MIKTTWVGDRPTFPRPFIPRPGRAGITNSIRQFFNDNPSEELTIAEMVVKFGYPREHVRQTAIRLRKLGELDARMEGRTKVYRRAA